MRVVPDPPEHLPAEAPEDFAIPEKYDALSTEFERGKTTGLREARLHYARGFTDGLIVAFTFTALGAGFVWFVSAALA